MSKALLEQIAAMRSYISIDAFRQYCDDAKENGAQAMDQGAFFFAIEAELAKPELSDGEIKTIWEEQTGWSSEHDYFDIEFCRDLIAKSRGEK